jgi:hypothetical protein
MQGGSAMKKLSTAVFLGLWILVSLGCSSTPSGTMAVKDLQESIADRIGQDVVVVGMADTRTPMASFKMFKLSSGNNYVWASIPEDAEEPPQGLKVRVTGTVQQKEFPAMGNVVFIESTKVGME